MARTREANDSRKQWLLRPGDKICCGRQEYTISGEPIGYGGSSVIYPASMEGSHRRYAVKDCMPARFSRFCRQGGVIRPADPQDVALEQLRQYRKMLAQERKIGQILSGKTGRVISIWEDMAPTAIHTGEAVHTDVSEGIFSLMDRVDRKGMPFRELLRHIAETPSAEEPLKTGGLPRIHTTCQMIRQTLLALERVHSAGFLFGDMQDGNVFFTDCRLEREQIGTGNLLDFGSARPLEADGKTAPIEDSRIFTTEGFTPPEILYENNGLLRLGREADIYGVGCLLLRCVLPPMVIRMQRQALDEDDGGDIGCTGSARKLLNRILARALAPKPEDRYSDADAMLQDIQALMALVKPPENILPRNLSAPEYFVPGSREREIEEVVAALQRGEQVFLHGLGGIGKTETAIQAAQRVATVKGAYLVHYQESMRHTIAMLPFEEEENGQKPENRYHRNLRILREEYRGVVLILDNFDVAGKTLLQLQQEEAYRDLLALTPELKLIFTTRYPHSRADWEITPLAEEDLLKLMRYHLGGRTIPEEMLRSLIREVKGHTLLLTLMAKALHRSSRLMPEAILENLRSGSLPESSCAVDSGQMKSEGRQYSQKDIQSHMTSLFRLTGLTEPQKEALRCAVLLPPEGMDSVLFEDALGEMGEQQLLSLLDMGWLRRGSNLVTIHPVIREVCRQEWKPTGDCCIAFLERLWQQYESNGRSAAAPTQCGKFFDLPETLQQTVKRVTQTRAGLIQYALCFENACRLDWASSGDKMDCADKTGILYYNMWEYDKAACFHGEALRLAQQDPGTTPDALADRNIKLGEALQASGNFAEYGEYFLRARQIQQTHTLRPEIQIQLFSRLVDMYIRENQYKEAMAVCREWGTLCATDPERFFSESLMQKIRLSEIYEDMLQERKARKLLCQVLREVQSRPDCMDREERAELLISCAELLRISATGSLKQAREFYLSAIGIYADCRDADHPMFVKLYFDTALCCQLMRRYEEAVQFAHMALALCEQHHPDGYYSEQIRLILGDSCYMQAKQLCRRGECKQALPYAEEAYLRRLDAEDKYLRLAASQLAAIHRRLGNKELAAEYGRQAFRLKWYGKLVMAAGKPDAAKGWRRIWAFLSELRGHIRFAARYLAEVLRFWKDDRKQ